MTVREMRELIKDKDADAVIEQNCVGTKLHTPLKANELRVIQIYEQDKWSA